MMDYLALLGSFFHTEKSESMKEKGILEAKNDSNSVDCAEQDLILTFFPQGVNKKLLEVQ